MPSADKREAAPSGQYRRDIDGLRAVAILSVLFAHAAIPGFSGGFVGVDVFFVISGFLITGLVIARIEAGTFSLLDFFERRASRLLPALMAVLLVAAAFGYVVLTPAELVLLGQDISATALFAMNFQGWATSGYFGPEAATRIVLHAWSLAVEEQFYLLFPPMLWLAWHTLRRWGPRQARTAIILGVAAMIIGSFGLQQMLVEWPTTAAFYLLPPRMWELGAGALLALLLRHGAVRPVPQPIATALGGLALVLILWPVTTFDEHTPFPGFAAAPPVLGAAMLIWAGTAAPANPVSRLLSWPLLVGIGLISYSLYLWHWPVLAFARLWNGRFLSPGEGAALLVAATAIAWLSWRFIEQPFRQRKPDQKVKQRLLLALLATLAAVGIGQAFVRTGGLPQRADNAIRQLDQDTRPATDLMLCTEDASGACRFPAQGLRRGTIVLWGDSHAIHFSPAVAQAMTDHGYEVVRFTSASCPPLPGTRLSILQDRGAIGPTCMEFNRTVPGRLAAIDDLRLVILAGRWTAFLSADWKETQDRWFMTEDGRMVASGEAVSTMRGGILRAASEPTRRGVPVMVFEQVAEFPFLPPNCMGRAIMLNRPSGSCRDSTDIGSPERQELHRMLDGLQRANPLISAYHAEAEMCSTETCDPAPRGPLLYRDAHHLGLAGARHFAPVLEPVLLDAVSTAGAPRVQTR